MNIIIRSDAELQVMGFHFRQVVAGNPIKPEDHIYSKTQEEFRDQVIRMVAISATDGHRHIFKLLHHDSLVVSVVLTLDQDEKVSDYHMSCVSFNIEMRKYSVVPDNVAHKMAELIAGPNWWEVPHPGTMIPQIRHFLSKNLGDHTPPHLQGE